MIDTGQRQTKKPVSEVSGEIVRGRRYCDKRAWADAFGSLSRPTSRLRWVVKISSCWHCRRI